MRIRTIPMAIGLIAALVAAQPSAILAQRGEIAAKHYTNCTALNRVYPHGVGRIGAVDHVRAGTARVTNFTRNNRVYNANSGSDRDHDKIACEKL